jgi:aminoglycoside 6'-N-acetyltransferase
VTATPPPTLATERLKLRPLTREDTPDLLAMLAQPGVEPWWGVYDAQKLERDFFDTSWSSSLVIEVGGAFAGVILYHETEDPDYRMASIDITLGDEYQDRGLGTEALRTLIAWLIDTRGHHRLTIDPAATNARAIHTYAKVGFRPVGIMRAYERGPDGSWHDGLLMDLLAEEFVRA